MSANVKTASKPVHKIRSGAIEVAIWRNESEKGPWFSVTMSRSYKKDEAWKQADSYGTDDLLLLAKLLDLAHTWILLHEPQGRARKQDAA
jgi:hypothetical protein